MINSQQPVINVSGDYEETILRLAKHLGKDRNRRAVFNLIYGRGSRPKSKKQIAETLGKVGNAQVIQNALDDLAKHHLIVRIENKGAVKDGSRWLYGKENSVRANRDKIVRFADDPGAAKKVATKRRPAPLFGVSFVKEREGPARRTARPRGGQSEHKNARLRIALLVTNPKRNSALQTGIEARDIESALKATGKWNEIDLKLFLAPTLNELIDALNIFRPNILHFSGHGGGGTLLFDNEKAGNDGGTVLDFDMVARVIGETKVRPNLLVLAACDTVDGSDRFMNVVPAVVAMADPIDDDAACAFSARFYQSLAGGASIRNALNQAKILLEHKGYADAALPQLIAANDKAADRTFL